MYVNKVFLIGNLTRDPEMRALPSGVKVTSFSLATNRVYKDQSGARKEATDYHNVVVFGRQAETSGTYLKKGQTAFVEGRLTTRSWEQDGQKKYRTEIIADAIQFGPKAQGGGGYTSGNNNKADSNDGVNQDISSKSEDSIEYPEDEINPEDIPF
jgi:single-strand DNA-binding protein